MPERCSYDEIIKIHNEIIFTDVMDFVEARKQADNASAFWDTTLLNIPRLINTLRDDTAEALIRRLWLDTISGEYFLLNKEGHSIYAIAHGNHPLDSAARIEKGWKERNSYDGFFPMTDEEAYSILADAIPVSEVRRNAFAGQIDASRNTIYIDLDNNDKRTIFHGQNLRYDQWMIDDRILAICGSENNRESLGKFFFKKEKWNMISINNLMHPNDMMNYNVGSLLGLAANGEGIFDNKEETVGHFAALRNYDK
jgi:hypothetical protein